MTEVSSSDKGAQQQLSAEDLAASSWLDLLSADEAEEAKVAATPPAPAPVTEAAEETEHAAAEEEPPAEEDDPEELPEPKRYRVKVNGEEREVTEDELIKGYSRTEDYTRKTQKLAEERKVFEPELAAVREERKRYAESIKKVELALKSVQPQEPDWDERRKTLPPDQFAALRADWSIHQDRIRAVQLESQRAAQLVADDQLKQRKAYVAAEHAELLTRIPEWKDQAIREKDAAAMRAHALSLGFTDAQVDEVADARTILLLRQAWKNSVAEKAKPTIRQNINRLRAVTPGSANSSAPRPQASELAKARARLAKTGSIDDAAALFFNEL